MKNGKRIWSLFLTAALFLFFVSCGSGETNATTAAASSEKTAVASGASTAAGGTAEFPQMTLKAGTVTTADSGYVRALEDVYKRQVERSSAHKMQL